MKGDFSKFNFDPKKHYTRVLKQQGRVDLDSDWNEQAAILEMTDRQRAIDVIGPAGAPKKNAGFEIHVEAFLNDVDFPSADIGWAVGNSANILFTRDGGETWQRLPAPTGVAVNLRGVYFATVERGHAAGDDATILFFQTDEGGNTTVIEQQAPADVKVNLNSIYFERGNINNGWAVGDEGTILSTEDGGETWVRQSPPEGNTGRLRSVYFASNTEGWIVGDDAVILYTSNGGENWIQQAAPAGVTAHLNSVYFRTVNDGWIVGNGATVLHTSDGGNSWEKQDSLPGEVTDNLTNLWKVYFETTDMGWAVGSDGIIINTVNGGADWTKQNLPAGITPNLRSITFDSIDNGWIVGVDGVIFATSDGGGSWSGQDLPEDFTASIVGSAGRIYVDGLSCDLEQPLNYLNQPEYPTAPPLSNLEDDRTDLIYLDVWQRHITAIEDPEIKEIALGGPDTTTRLKTICQIKVAENVGAADCPDDLSDFLPAPGGGRLSTRLKPVSDPNDACLIAPEGGYRGLENRFYRVEIHEPGDMGTATFKWSRDNGAVVFAIENFDEFDSKKIKVKRIGRDQVLALHVGDWVEVLGSETELSGNHGTLAQITQVDEVERILTLDRDVSAHNSENHPKARRWDQPGDALSVSAGPVDLEDGIQIEFSGENFKCGDYWVFAARVITGDIEHLNEQPPKGIAHHYCKLALVTWHSEPHSRWRAEVKDCKPHFPSLTEICAEDVCFDNGSCDLPEAETVQDALDRLCAARDLRFHNKHLHGWGIVCGLQVYCGPEDEKGRNKVTVKDGYAIDCEGNDLVLDEPATVRIIEIIRKKGLLKEGEDGEVCITMGLDENNELAFDVEKYDPSSNPSWIDGTLLYNFYNKCIKNLFDFFEAQFTEDPEGSKELVTPVQKRLTVLLNLLFQFVNPTYGGNVYLSPQEDEILRDFYEGLKELLKSKTFCAMFENVRPFPTYPVNELNVSTVFGKGYHQRLRMDHQSKRLYTVGGGSTAAKKNMIHVYDIADQKIVAEVEMPGGEGIEVQDVAFSAAGNQLYAVATVNDKNTIFAIADIQEGEELTFKWQPITMICDTMLVTLQTAPSISENVYAVGQGTGLYVIDPQNIDPQMEPITPFKAVGHLVIHEPSKMAFATARTDDVNLTEYDQVQRINLSDFNSETFPLVTPDGNSFTGEDDIEVFESPNLGNFMYVVINPGAGFNDQNKRLMIFDNIFGDTHPALKISNLDENTAIRLKYNPVTEFMMVAFEDSYRIRLVDLHNFELLTRSYHHPVQLFPRSLVRDDTNQKLYVLNWISNTINPIPLDRFTPEYKFPLDKLAEYRDGVIEAFMDLLGGFLQYLKDCFCDQFLVNCPQCDENDKLYLACASIRENEVYQVCNFSKRKYVKSFPTMAYWLSMFPVGALVKKAFQEICCSVLPNLFAGFEAPRPKGFQQRVGGFQMRNAYFATKNYNVGGVFMSGKEKISFTQKLGGDWLKNIFNTQMQVARRPVKQADLIGKPLSKVQKKLDAENIQVEKVETYDPKLGPQNLLRFSTASPDLKENSRIILYEQDGVVKYYAMAPKPSEAVAEIRARVDQQETKFKDVDKLEKEVGDLKKTLKASQKDQEKVLKEREKEISDLKKTLASMQKEVGGIKDLKKQIDALAKK